MKFGPYKMLAKLCLITNLLQLSLARDFSQLRINHVLRDLNTDQVEYLAQQTDTKHIDDILDNILIPRVVGTPNHKKVQTYLINELENFGFTTEIDKFDDVTPNMGVLTFTNIIGTLNPNAERFLVLACHYDSKYYENDEFVGATDSAVPCAMLLNLAKVMKNELKQAKSNDDLSLMLLFLDGEEAFERWGPTDSIYGARHLANKWHRSVTRTSYGDVNSLQKVDAFVLLDLLGTPNPKFFSYFKKTERLFLKLCDAEDKLSKANLLEEHSPSTKYFKRRSTQSFVEDDHVPFMIRGVPILHLIPKEFPKVWHTPQDDRSAIDMPTIENLNKILRVFVAEYLHLLTTKNDDNEEITAHQHFGAKEL